MVEKKKNEDWLKTTVYLSMRIRSILKAQAIRNHRSLSQEIALIIEKEVYDGKKTTERKTN